ncbi:MAG: FG-GAP-like repeat-containing protein, partial [Candidatus Delongbacteria bacterium]|nr:FG-GAP-like repeat-containing protein [Candidatus Delongbacteria bacterium]
DYDNDGDLDVMITGGDYINIKIYKNENGIFSEIDFGLIGGETSFWGDYDNDGDLDILLSGSDYSSYYTKIYRNEIGTPNTVPEPPENLSATIIGNDVTFTWNKATDAETPQNGLSYNLYIGTDSLYVKSPMSNDSTGYRKVVKIGNANQVNSWTIKDLPDGTYYWSVQAIDHTFAGSEFSEKQTLIKVSPFVDINAVLTGIGASSISWGDYDNDGDLDVLLTGINSIGYTSTLLRNDAGVFTEINSGLENAGDGSAAWGDYDNDGDLDILLAGYNGSDNFTKIYRNDNGIFTDINAGLLGVCNGSTEWGDYDNDGDLDILLTGDYGAKGLISSIYRNDAGIFTDINAGLQGFSQCSGSWGDYDNDGDLDILLSGVSDGPESFASLIYRNDAGIFTNINAGLIGVFYSSAAWGDFDNDGDLDILLAGTTYFEAISKIYRNDSGEFTDIDAGLYGIADGSAKWGDYDNDGDLDILLSGCYNSFELVSKIYRNDSGIFTDVSAVFAEFFQCSAEWGDYDNDGDLDFLIAGAEEESGNISQIYRNTCSTPNTAPSSPSNLITAVNDSTVTFSWDKATDVETPQNGLSYNLYIRSDSLYVKSPMSNDSTGYRKIVKTGNANQINSWTINNLPGGKYYWSVQAIDNAFAGSAFAAEKSFIIGTLAIPSNVAISKLTGNVTVSWSAVVYADSYKIYACEDPYGTFEDVSEFGTFDGTTWTQTLGGNKLFYYVVAVAEDKGVTKKEIKIGNVISE